MYYNSDYGDIYYEVYGVEGNPTLVFTHGVTMDHKTFYPQVEFLKDHFRIVIWDMPLHGKSCNIDTSFRFSITAANILLDLLDYLEIEKGIFAGLSYGSIISQHIAYEHPEKVIALIAISGQSLYPKRNKLLNIFKWLLTLVLVAKTNKSIAKSFAKHKTNSSEVKKHLEEGVYNVGKKNYIYLNKELINDLVIGSIEKIKCPLLILYGDSEFNSVKKMHQKWHSSTPRSKIVKIDNANHITNQDNPQEVNEAIINFYQGLITLAKPS